MTEQHNWHAVAIDVTRYFNIRDEDKPYVEKIDAVHFFDKNQHTHCCDLSPSYLLCGIYHTVHFPLNTPDDVRERLFERYELEGPDDCYMYCRDVERLKVIPLPKHHDSDEEEVREHLQGNHLI